MLFLSHLITPAEFQKYCLSEIGSAPLFRIIEVLLYFRNLSLVHMSCLYISMLCLTVYSSTDNCQCWWYCSQHAPSVLYLQFTQCDETQKANVLTSTFLRHKSHVYVAHAEEQNDTLTNLSLIRTLATHLELPLHQFFDPKPSVLTFLNNNSTTATNCLHRMKNQQSPRLSNNKSKNKFVKASLLPSTDACTA